MTRIGRFSLVGGWALAMLLAGCTSVQPFQAGPPSQSPSAESPPAGSLPAGPPLTESPPTPPGHDTSAATAPPSPYFAQPAPHPAPGGQARGGIAHIVVIVQENKAASQIMGAGEAG